jgi:hypothetical protein
MPIRATGYDQFVLSIGPFDRAEHAEFAGLLKHRLGVEIHYGSLYGGEGLERSGSRTRGLPSPLAGPFTLSPLAGPFTVASWIWLMPASPGAEDPHHRSLSSARRPPNKTGGDG